MNMEQVLSGLRVRLTSSSRLIFLLVGLLIIGWLLSTPPGLLGKADAIGYAVCHRIEARSFHIGARQLALCSRCTGMYLGAMLGLAYQSVVARRRSGSPDKRLWPILVFLVLTFGIDGINSYLHFFPGAPTLYEPQNWSRLVTGTGMGLAIAIVLYPAFNQAVWKKRDARQAIDSLRSVAILLGLGLALDLIVLTENPMFLYPLSLVSAAGVVILLTMVYSMVWLMLMRTENRYQHLSQMLLPLCAGLGLAILQIAVLDFTRYILTGTWEGFHIG
jgi:uncharacterized membrane protein